MTKRELPPLSRASDFTRLLCIFSLIVFILSLVSFDVQSKSVSRDRAKSIFIHKIFLNMRWSDEKSSGPFKVGFYGRDKILKNELVSIFDGKKIRGKEVKITTVSSLAAAQSFQALIISSKYNRYIADIAEKLRRSQTLLITDMATDKRSVMINFIDLSSQRLAFEINRSSILYEGLKPSKNLLLFGGTELDIAVLHKETEAELAKAVESLEKQRDKMEKQLKLLEDQAKTITSQKEGIEEQRKHIVRQGVRIDAREEELKRLEGNLEKIKNALGESEGILQKKEVVLAKKEADIEHYSKKILKNLGRLKTQKEEIKKQEKLIAEKNLILSEQIHTIENQRFILVAAIAALLTFFTLIVVIFRSSQEKMRVNKMLKTKTDELETANQKLLHMSEAKSQFLSTMSHEIRTPLNGVLGMIELLKSTDMNDQQSHYLDTVHSSGEMLLSVINDILDYSKIEAGKMPIEIVEYNLEKLIFGCTPVFSQRVNENLSFIADIPDGTPLCLKGDPTRIRQILLNLLSNAFKFTEKGEIRLEAKAVKPVGERPQCRITVSDTGVGLSKQQCSIIFKAFTQADSTTTRRYGGSGLGLVISMRLANLMGGVITVESKPGKGSRFTLKLPLVRSGPSSRISGDVLIGQGLLIIDSNKSQQHVLSAHAKAWGMKVYQALTPQAAKDILVKSHPGLVLVAEHIGNYRGLEVAKALVGLKTNSKVLLQNSVVSPVSASAQEQAGVKAFYEMPMAPSLLREMLIRQLTGRLTEEPKRLARKISHKKRFEHANVLVVEDNAVNRMVINGFLAKLGVIPEFANNGLEAVESYKHKCKGVKTVPYDLILMDCEMPEMDGFTATEEIRALESREKRSRVAIVALTAHVLDAQKNKAIEAGMHEHLAKPVEFEALQRMLSRYIPDNVTRLVRPAEANRHPPKKPRKLQYVN